MDEEHVLLSSLFPMSLVKLPFIFSAALGFHTAFTSPNVPPPADESIVSPGLREIVLYPIVAWGCGIMKVIYWTGALTETVAVFSPYFTASRSEVLRSVASNFQALKIHNTPITPAFLAGSALLTAGGILRWLCFRELGRFFTFYLSFRKGHKLVTTGPYSIVRHPGYTGTLICLVGACIMHGSRGSWLMSSGVLSIPGAKELAISWILMLVATDICLVMRISKEDEMMRAGFKDEWSEWARRVRYCLIPGVY
ncbi:hypothetical protein BJ138DRAFT_886460 [Hygrophoropsis aurantiaca]|uniref:Uncharacterized protein n=1 Tax=Hygrophoropsis aurantiaca TaxID=72124 RepID=A0ACB8AEK1_9AGAM|nr:hypothetical protein BJ138DRAFT_886460 [Hygrophoropsis aurantiaca]